MDTHESQRKQVLRYLQENGSITPNDADNLCAAKRLASIIGKLRDSGYHITTEIEHGHNRFGNKVHYARYHYQESNN
jgi:hypothetical protein